MPTASHLPSYSIEQCVFSLLLTDKHNFRCAIIKDKDGCILMLDINWCVCVRACVRACAMMCHPDWKCLDIDRACVPRLCVLF